MKPLRARIRQAAERTKSPQPVVEKDYALSYVLAGLASHPVLADTLVFKGGTALKKLFFGEYRFSEDLDFSAVEAPTGEDLEAAFREAIQVAGRLLADHGPFAVETERYLGREPHPRGQEAFTVRVKFPWHPGPVCRIKVEITFDEPVLLTPEARALIHEYEEDLSILVRGYRLEEIVAEKMRTLLQTHQKLVARGWNRPRARDYYDLWRVLGTFGESLERDGLPELLERKSTHRSISFGSLEDFFPETLVSEARTHWSRSLGPFVRDLPACDDVLDGLRSLLPVFFPNLVRSQRA